MTEDPNEGRRLVWAIAPGALLAGISAGIAFPILPIVGQRVGLSLGFIGLILAGNRLSRVVASPIVGIFADRFGGRRTYLVGLVIQLLVMGLFWLGVKTPHAGALFLAGRLIHGPGSSCTFVAGQSLALQAAGEKARGQATGIVRGATAVGVPVGLVLGGVLADGIGEAETFAVAAVALVAATIGAFFLLPDLRVTVAHPPTLRVAFRALGSRQLAAIGGLNFVATFVGGGMVLTTTALVIHERRIDLLGRGEKTTAGIFMAWLVIVEAASMPILGRVGDRLDAHARVAIGGLVCMIPALLVIAGAGGAVSFALGVGLLGVGIGALGPSTLALLDQRVPPELRGIALGGLQVTADLGGAVGPLVGTAVFAEDAARPYLLAATVVTLFLIPAVWLARGGPAGGGSPERTRSSGTSSRSRPSSAGAKNR